MRWGRVEGSGPGHVGSEQGLGFETFGSTSRLKRCYLRESGPGVASCGHILPAFSVVGSGREASTRGGALGSGGEGKRGEMAGREGLSP